MVLRTTDHQQPYIALAAILSTPSIAHASYAFVATNVLVMGGDLRGLGRRSPQNLRLARPMYPSPNIWRSSVIVIGCVWKYEL